MSTFTDRLGLLLYEYDMNKSQLARRVGVAVSTVHRWWDRGNMPEYRTLLKVAEVFNVSPDWLEGNSEVREVEPIPETKKEDELDEELVRLIKGLTPAQIQRVRDFLSGLRG